MYTYVSPVQSFQCKSESPQCSGRCEQWRGRDVNGPSVHMDELHRFRYASSCWHSAIVLRRGNGQLSQRETDSTHCSG